MAFVRMKLLLSLVASSAFVANSRRIKHHLLSPGGAMHVVPDTVQAVVQGGGLFGNVAYGIVDGYDGVLAQTQALVDNPGIKLIAEHVVEHAPVLEENMAGELATHLLPALPSAATCFMGTVNFVRGYFSKKSAKKELSAREERLEKVTKLVQEFGETLNAFQLALRQQEWAVTREAFRDRGPVARLFHISLGADRFRAAAEKLEAPPEVRAAGLHLSLTGSRQEVLRVFAQMFKKVPDSGTRLAAKIKNELEFVWTHVIGPALQLAEQQGDTQSSAYSLPVYRRDPCTTIQQEADEVIDYQQALVEASDELVENTGNKMTFDGAKAAFAGIVLAAGAAHVWPIAAIATLGVSISAVAGGGNAWRARSEARDTREDLREREALLKAGYSGSVEQVLQNFEETIKQQTKQVTYATEIIKVLKSESDKLTGIGFTKVQTFLGHVRAALFELNSPSKTIHND